ncbi:MULTISPECIES: hypothetical protein [Streptacidiphilus]|uniref:Uncharacterized protein n=1 Tax=Streptacidiphilus cavernicola TaxID=3342716 RepID=A0ABV6UWD1_9ACTN|nr:hypothetical protein [Streptacidiphilus jeojiense]
MTATSDRRALPTRRRRHARLIAALTELIGACAEAAAAVYRPIAAAPPVREVVEVALLPCVQVSLTAALLLDRARVEDCARWPDVVVWERGEARRTYTERCAVATARDLVEQADPPGAGGVPLPTVEQVAAMGLVAAGDEVTAQWRRDPAEAAALVLQLAAGASSRWRRSWTRRSTPRC